MRGSRREGRGGGPPLEFVTLDIADITGNEKNSYFSYLCTSTVTNIGGLEYFRWKYTDL